MEYRFVKISSFYKNFLHQYYKSNPDIVTGSYTEQYQHLVEQGYGYSDYFPRYLQQNFSIPGTELIHNAGPLQSSWAREHGLELSGNRLLLEQLKTYKPEILFIQDSSNFSASFIQKIKEELKSLKLLIGHCCAPYNSENIRSFRQYHVILTCSEKFLDDFRKQNIHSRLFPHAVESSLIRQTEKITDRSNEIIFIGSLLYRDQFHKNRISYVEEILKNELPLKIYGQLDQDPWHILKMKQAAYLFVKLLSSTGNKQLLENKTLKKTAQLTEMPRRSPYSEIIRKHCQYDPVFGKEMLSRMAGYTVGYNQHAEVAGDYAANIRMFEVTGAGTLLVTDHKKNIHSLFEPDTEILTYKNKADCIEKLRWAIKHPEEARQIARAGQLRALKDHSVEKRVELLHEIFRKEL